VTSFVQLLAIRATCARYEEYSAQPARFDKEFLRGGGFQPPRSQVNESNGWRPPRYAERNSAAACSGTTGLMA
jgi:hypothetical protein